MTSFNIRLVVLCAVFIVSLCQEYYSDNSLSLEEFEQYKNEFPNEIYDNIKSESEFLIDLARGLLICTDDVYYKENVFCKEVPKLVCGLNGLNGEAECFFNLNDTNLVYTIDKNSLYIYKVTKDINGKYPISIGIKFNYIKYLKLIHKIKNNYHFLIVFDRIGDIRIQINKDLKNINMHHTNVYRLFKYIPFQIGRNMYDA